MNYGIVELLILKLRAACSGGQNSYASYPEIEPVDDDAFEYRRNARRYVRVLELLGRRHDACRLTKELRTHKTDYMQMKQRLIGL